jgi:7-dehydrocholesterol reductase
MSAKVASQAVKGAATAKKTWGSGGLLNSFRPLGAVALILATPVASLLFYYTCLKKNGSAVSLLEELAARVAAKGLLEGIWELLSNMWPSPFQPTAWKLVGSYMAFELFLMRFVPGKEFKATATPSGHVPTYNANGVQCYVITIATLFALYHYDLFNPGQVYDEMLNILSALNLFAVCFCVLLMVKGWYMPDTKESGTNGSIIDDFFWGTDLYPRIFGWDVKQFTNCRFGMMFWQVGIICYAIKQYQNEGRISESMLVSVFLQTVYIAKFFWWETGYFCSMDIQHDRAGYYICWGCLVWVPSMYTVHTFFMVEHPVALTAPTAVFFAAAGVFSIWVNYDCDRYKQTNLNETLLFIPFIP